MFNRKRIKQLESRVDSLEKKIDELQKRTVSQKTMEEDQPPTVSVIMDEWLNGKEEDNGY